MFPIEFNVNKFQAHQSHQTLCATFCLPPRTLACKRNPVYIKIFPKHVCTPLPHNMYIFFMFVQMPSKKNTTYPSEIHNEHGFSNTWTDWGIKQTLSCTLLAHIRLYNWIWLHLWIHTMFACVHVNARDSGRYFFGLVSNDGATYKIYPIRICSV